MNILKLKGLSLALALLACGRQVAAAEIHDAARNGYLETVKALLKADPNSMNARDADGRTPLHWAALSRQVSIVEALMTAQAELTAKDNQGLTPLHSAALGGHTAIIALLLTNHAEIDAKNNTGHTPLNLAVQSDNVEAVATLLANKAAVNTFCDQGATPLHDAASRGNKQMVRLLLDHQAQVDAKDNTGHTPLNRASASGNPESAAMLLAAGADVNSGCIEGRTPLYDAAVLGRQTMVELLLAHHAEINAKDHDGATPLNAAIEQGHKGVADFLREHGGQEGTLSPGAELCNAAAAGNVDRVKALLAADPALVNVKDRSGHTPLHRAAEKGQQVLAEVLIARGADVNVQSPAGNTPLHRAAREGHAPVAKLLLDKQANPNAKDREGGTPLHDAATMGRKDVVSVLLDNGADVNAKDNAGNTPLHRSVASGHGDVVAVLIADEADVNARNNDGVTPLHLAATAGNNVVVASLLASKADAGAKTKGGEMPLDLAVKNGHTQAADLLRARLSAGAGGVPGRLVGDLGDPSRLGFAGLETFSSDAIRQALVWQLDFHLAAHPAAPLAEYLQSIQTLVLAGYRHGGFPEAKVTANLDDKGSNIVVKVTQGPRYLCGDIKVTGARSIPVAELTRQLAENFSPLSASHTNLSLVVSWAEGGDASFDDASLRSLLATVTNTLANLGYLFAKARVNVVPAPGSHTADLLVEIVDEGPKAVIGEIEIVGAKKNTREEILRYLKIAPGTSARGDTVQTAEKRLRDSARFRTFQVMSGSPDREGKIKLHLDLAELDQAPSLGQELSPVETALLKLGNWLSDVTSRTEDMVCTIADIPTPTRAGLQLQFIYSSAGILFAIRDVNSEARGRTPLRYAMVLAPDTFGLFSLDRRRKLVSRRQPFQIDAVFSFEPALDPNQSFNLGIGAGINSTDALQPLRLDLTLVPAAFLLLAHPHETNVSFSFDRNVLLVSENDPAFRLKVDTATGRLIELTGSSDSNQVSFRVNFEPGAFARALDGIGDATADCRNDFDPKSQFSSAVRFLAVDLLRIPFLAQTLFKKVPAEKIGRASDVLEKLFAKQILSPLNGLGDGGNNTDAGGFTIVPDGVGAQQSPTATMMPLLSAAVINWADRLLPQRSWLMVLTRETCFFINGRTRYLDQDMNGILTSDQTGPIGLLTAAKLLAKIPSPAARVFAAKGLERLSPDDFRKDYRLLFEGDSILSQCAIKTAQALGELSPEDIEAFAAMLGPDEAEFLRESARQLHATKDKPIVAVLAPALDHYWDRRLKKWVETAFKQLAR